MALSIGIVGLPNVGKSTAFNALTRTQQAQAANYPFCTIQPNRAIVPVPDARLAHLAALTGVPQAIPATIEFVDIAGLVRGAHRGEGLGNQFLGQIRNVDAILHVVRCFEDPNVAHISGQIDPQADIEVLQLELALADLEQVERKIEKLSGEAKADKSARQALALAERLRAHLAQGLPASGWPANTAGWPANTAGWPANTAGWPADEVELGRALVEELRLLTALPVIFAANLDEAGLAGDSPCAATVRRIAASQGHRFVQFCAQLEMATVDLDEDERRDFLALAGAEESSLEALIRTGYDVLGLISFFTKNEQEARAWTLAQGATAPQAAGKIHTDFERGFIRAEVVAYDVFVRHGSDAAVRAAGALRVEGRDYVVQDGDIILFRFNV